MSEEIKALEGLQEIAAVDVAEIAASREPVRDELGRSYATGKRKDAVALVWNVYLSYMSTKGGDSGVKEDTAAGD